MTGRVKKNTAGHSVHALKVHEKKDAAGQSVHAVKMASKAPHEKKNAAGQSVKAIKMTSKRKCSAVADEEAANFECPTCHRLYFYATPREKSGNKRKHQPRRHESGFGTPCGALVACTD
jgi:hypothetical protein